MKSCFPTLYFFLVLFFVVATPSLADNPTPETYCFLRAEALCSLQGKRVVYSLVKKYVPNKRDELLAEFQEELSAHYAEYFEVTFDVFSHLYNTKEDAEYAREMCIVKTLQSGGRVNLVSEEKLAKHQQH